MPKTYTKMTDTIYTETLKELIDTKEEFNDIKQTEPKILMIAVSNMDKAGVTLPAFDNQGLPYMVKINSPKDRVITGYSLIFYFDSLFINNCITEKEIEALIYSALNKIEFSFDKNGDYITDNDGVCKMKNRKADFILEGYSNVIDEYKENSPEMKMYNQIVNDNPESFN